MHPFTSRIPPNESLDAASRNFKKGKKRDRESSSINKKGAVQLHSIALSSEVSSFSSQRPLSAPPYQTMVLNLVQERGKSLLLFFDSSSSNFVNTTAGDEAGLYFHSRFIKITAIRLQLHC